jgi:hypothetical protein
MENTASAQSGPETTQRASRAATLRSMASSILINGVLPFVIYWALTNYTHTTEFLALVASSVPSIIDSLIGVVRRKRIDFLAAIVLAGIAVSLIITLLGGSPKVYLIRESFFTVAFGLVCLGSLLFPRPLIFYFARYFATGNHPENIPWFDSLWQYKGFRTNMRTTTVVWGIGFLIEAAIRIYLVIILTPGQFLVVSPFVIYGIIGILTLWTFTYSRQGRKRSEEIRQQMLAQQAAQQSNTTPSGE